MCIHNQCFKMSRLPQSHAFRNLDFLIRLGSARRKEDRIEMCRGLTTSQLRGVAEVADCVVNRKISILRYDKGFFKTEEYLLRILADYSLSEARRRNNLIRRHMILPRLLRRSYVRASIGVVSRALS